MCNRAESQFTSPACLESPETESSPKVCFFAAALKLWSISCCQRERLLANVLDKNPCCVYIAELNNLKLNNFSINMHQVFPTSDHQTTIKSIVVE